MWKDEKPVPVEGPNKSIMRASGLRNFEGKNIDELSEDDCARARQFIFKRCGITYY